MPSWGKKTGLATVLYSLVRRSTDRGGRGCGEVSDVSTIKTHLFIASSYVGNPSSQAGAVLALAGLPLTSKSCLICSLITLADVFLLLPWCTPGMAKEWNKLLTSSREKLVSLRSLCVSKEAAPGMVSVAWEQDSRCWRLHVSLYFGGRSEKGRSCDWRLNGSAHNVIATPTTTKMKTIAVGQRNRWVPWVFCFLSSSWPPH